MGQLKTICIIPARGGSKRLPKKNLRLFNNHPLIGSSILYAQQYDFIDKIVVSTDDEAIKTAALAYGVNVVDRPEDLSGDSSTTVSALKHVLESVETDYDIVILLQPTNPLRPKFLLHEAYKKFVNSSCDSLLTVSRSYQKLGKIIDERFTPFNYTMGERSQDLKPLYFENGLLYITKSVMIMQDKILGDRNIPFVVDHQYAKVDIDTEEDFKFAEYVLKQFPYE